MRFLLDENVHIGVADSLQKKGHDVNRVPPGIKNGEVIGLASQENRVLITQDKDFLDQERYPPSKYPGIVCLRIHPPVLQQIVKSLDILLDQVPENKFAGVTFVLNDEHIEMLRG